MIKYFEHFQLSGNVHKLIVSRFITWQLSLNDKISHLELYHCV